LFPTLRMLVSSGAVLYPAERAAVMRRLTPNLVNLYPKSGSWLIVDPARIVGTFGDADKSTSSSVSPIG